MDTSANTQARVRNPRGEGERLRETLLDTAIELLGDLQDWQALSIRTLTSRAGVSPTALYLHFSDKEALLAAVKERCFTALTGYLRAGAARAGDNPRAQAHAMCSAYLQFAAEQPGYYRALFETSHGDPARAREALSAVAPAWPPAATEALSALIGGIARCLPGGVSPEPIATMIWTGLHGYASLRRAVHHYPFPPAERYVTALLNAHLQQADRS